MSVFERELAATVAAIGGRDDGISAADQPSATLKNHPGKISSAHMTTDVRRPRFVRRRVSKLVCGLR
jgi:hypothetical protein